VNQDKEHIALFNLKKDKFVTSTKIEGQASKNYYYGEDQVVEKKLSHLEGLFSLTIRDMLNGHRVERYESVEQNQSTINLVLSESYSSLLYFVAIMDLRNPERKRQHDHITDSIIKELIRHTPEGEDLAPFLDKYEIIRTNGPAEVLANAGSITDVLTDLNYKLLVNRTEYPFITSDNPVVRYNQWFEQRFKRILSNGFGSMGAQIFIPINDRLQLMLYDETIYQVGRPKHDEINIARKADVDKLNVLQFLNCLDNVYGNEKINESYIRSIKQIASNYKRPGNSVHEKFASPFRKNGVIHFQEFEGIRCNLSLAPITFTDFANTFQDTGFASYARPHVQRLKSERDKSFS
jgi:hypothetical protein